MIVKKVFIPCAGVGSRLGAITQNINKALVPINHKPTISHIIENFSKNTIFVVALGYKGEVVRDYLKLAHPKSRFKFVNISNYKGPKSSLGLTLKISEKFLKEPFIFCSCDTFFKKKIKYLKNNWVGYSKKDDEQAMYRKLNFTKDELKISEKKINSNYCYIGLAGILDYKKFWFNFNKNLERSLKIGEIVGLNSLKLKKEKIEWHDTGNIKSLELVKKKFDKNQFNILNKNNEDIWFVNNKVIKFYKEKNLIKKKFLRSKILYNYVPKINFYKGNIFCYNFIKGKTFSENKKIKNFKLLLDFSKSLWKEKKLSQKQKKEFHRKCNKFYKLKTYKRINDFIKKYNIKTNKEFINNEEVPNIFELLKKINWKEISNGIPVRFHGDYHFENIIFNNSGFLSIDWRQDFSGLLNYGDIYYDLAKLLHGIIVSHKIVNRDKYVYKKKSKNITVSIQKTKNYKAYISNYKKWIIQNNYDFKKVQILTALIYLNIAVLHHQPYDKFLFYFGKLYLHQLLKKNDN